MARVSSSIDKVRRREFLLGTGAFCGLGMGNRLPAQQERKRVVLMADESFRETAAAPVRWAISQLLSAFEDAQVPAVLAESDCHIEDSDFYVAIGARTSELRRGFGSVEIPRQPEALTLAPGELWGRPATLIDGADARGLMYGALELAGRVRSFGLAGLALAQATAESPANQIRSMSRHS